MGFIAKVKEFFTNSFKTKAEKEFNVNVISSDEMAQAQDLWFKIIKDVPPWMANTNRTLNFAKFLCKYTAKKTCIDLAVTVEGSPRADFINQIIKAMVDKSIRDKVEDACGLGGLILKPNGNLNPSSAIDYVMPWNYVITEQTTNGDILGIIFFDTIQKGNTYYRRLEYHHFIDGMDELGSVGRYYQIENKAYMSQSETTLGNEINLEYVKEWENIEPVKTIDKVEKALFGYIKMPSNNTIDYASPEGVSVFADCIKELEDLDIAWGRKSDEIDDSQHITFIDEATISQRDARGNKVKIKLPRFVKGLKKGVDAGSTIDEHIATLLTENRIKDINSILSMISTKAGFSQGQFVLDRKTGNVTATQIESDDSETVETINDIRKSLKKAIKDLVYALNKYCDVVYNMPDGYVNVLDDNVPDEDIFYFKDLLVTFEQDRNRAYQLMMQGMYSKKKYLMEYEGFSEAEVEEMLTDIQTEIAQTQAMTQGLFSQAE